MTHSCQGLGPFYESSREVIVTLSNHYGNNLFKAQQPGLFLDLELNPSSAVYWQCDLEQVIAFLFALISSFIKMGVTGGRWEA